MAARRNNKLISLIVFVLVISIIAIIGFVAYFTNGFSKDLETFYIEYDGAKISSDGLKGLYILSSNEAVFNIKYIIPRQSGYRVSIAPNTENDFSFSVDGTPKDWRELGNITHAFSIEKRSDSFTIFMPESFSIERFLTILFPDNEVLIDSTPDIQMDLFIMTISSADGAQSVDIGFRVSNGVTGVTLDTEEITI